MAIHKDEIELAKLALEAHNKDKFSNGKWWYEDSSIPYKRVEYILNKWSERDLFDYGVTLRSGWLTEKGFVFWSNFIADMEQDIA